MLSYLFLCTEPRDSQGVTIKDFFHFIHDLREEITLRRAGMSVSARRVTLPAITPLVLQKRVCSVFPCCFFFSPCYCVFINMLETLVTYPERDFNSVRLQVIKEYVISFRLREKNNFFARKNIFVVKAPSNSSLVSISRHCDLETIGAFTFFPFYCNFRPLCL